MRICFVSHHSGLYGAEGALLELLDALAKQGIESRILAPYKGPLIQVLSDRGFDVKHIPFKWWVDRNHGLFRGALKTIWNIFMTLSAARQIRQWKCDVVYTNTVAVNVGALAAKALGLPHVWHIHEFGREDHGLFFDLGDRFSYRLIDDLSSLVIVNSKAVREKYRRYLPEDKLRVVYQSVTVADRETNVKQELTDKSSFHCAIVGRLQPGKKQEDALRALGKLRQSGIDVDLTVVGDGDEDYGRFLRDIAAQELIEDRVHFTGYMRDAFSCMHSMDVILICSQHEAFGRVTIEAMLAAKPVIGAGSGGTAELIREGVNGLLYAPGDYSDLAEKIQYLHCNRSTAAQMGRRGREWAISCFTRERYGQEIYSLLRDVCSGRPLKNQASCGGVCSGNGK